MAAPAQVLREALADARVQGVAFGEAWPGALAVALGVTSGRTRREWREALGGMEEAWRSAFCKEQPEDSVTALALVADGDREPCLFDRECANCGGPIPDGRGHFSPAKFCSDGCRRAGNRERDRRAASARRAA